MIILELLLISIIVCFIIDISGFIDSIKYGIWKWVFGNKRQYQDFNLKPFDCSLCMTFWAGIIWIIFTSQFSLLNVCLVSLFSAFSEEIANLIVIIKQIIQKVQDWLITRIE